MKNVDHITDESYLCHEIEYSHKTSVTNSYVVRTYDENNKAHAVIIPVETADKSIEITDVDLAVILYHRLMLHGNNKNPEAVAKMQEVIELLVKDKTISDIADNIIAPVTELT